MLGFFVDLAQLLSYLVPILQLTPSLLIIQVLILACQLDYSKRWGYCTFFHTKFEKDYILLRLDSDYCKQIILGVSNLAIYLAILLHTF